MARPWDAFLSDRDREVFDAAGYRQKMGFGERPALLIVDVSYGFCGDRREPVLDSIRRWPNSCGEAAWDALPEIARLVAAARTKGVPVIYTTGEFRSDGWDFGGWRWKTNRIDEGARMEPAARPNLDENEIMPQIAPAPRDIVIRKLKPSAFHGTPLTGHLTLLKADSLIVCGVSTSGCVRASVIDAFSENYRVAIAEEGCFDRSETSHAINLMDMDAKYADVLPCDEILDFIERLPEGLFDLPEGDGEIRGGS